MDQPRHVAAGELPRPGDGGVRPSAGRRGLVLGRGLLLFRAPSPVKRQWSEEPEDVVAVKEEPEELGRRGVVGPEDFVADVDAVAAAIAERSLHEEAERRRHDEEIEDLQWRQAVEANLAAKAKDDEWRRIREEQKAMYIELCSSGEED